MRTRSVSASEAEGFLSNLAIVLSEKQKGDKGMLLLQQSEHQPTTYNTITIGVIERRSRKVLLLQRNPHAYPNYEDPFANAWELIGGHVEAGEEPQAAAQREAAEETGLVLSQLDLVGISPFLSRNRPASNWIYVAFVEHEMPIVVSREHLAYAWQSVADVLHMQLAFKHSRIVEAIIRERSF